MFQNIITNPSIIFTRYLYLKDEVKLALLVSILNKSDDAIFWGYELYYSGFKHEFFDIVWKIYYDFFAIINPDFEEYLLKKHQRFLNEKENETNKKFVSSIIQNLLIRDFSCDIFLIRQICKLFVIHTVYPICEIHNLNFLKTQLKQWIDNYDYNSISYFILNESHWVNLSTIYLFILEIFGLGLGLHLENESKLTKFENIISNYDNLIQQKTILLSKILTLFRNKQKKSFYVIVTHNENVKYNTIELTNDIKHYKVLKYARICSIDKYNCLSMFELERNKTSYSLYDNWLYYASFTPEWFNRIKDNRGYVDYTNKKVKFIVDKNGVDWEEHFNNKFNYEPDEQCLDVNDKCKINNSDDNNWINFCKKHKTIFVEIDVDLLEELNSEKLVY